MATLPVKWFDNRFHGIPLLSGTPGAFTDLMDAVLVNGFGNTNVVSINVLDKKATLILQDGVRFIPKAVVALTNMSNQALNTEYRVVSADIGKLVIEMDVPDGPITVTNVVVKYAPIGWFKPFSGVSRGIYKPSKVDALNWMFYVDDTQALGAEVCICENATTIDNRIDQKPANNTYRWLKSVSANTDNRNSFCIIGDPYCFYYKGSQLNTIPALNKDYGCWNFVGEGVRLSKTLDPFAVYLTGQLNRYNTYNSSGNVFANEPSNSPKITLRPANGLKMNQSFIPILRNTNYWSYFTETLYYNSDGDSILFNEHFFLDDGRRITKIPGVVTSPGYKQGYTFESFIEAKDNNLGRDLIYSRSSPDSSSSSNPTMYNYFDITGPWR